VADARVANTSGSAPDLHPAGKCAFCGATVPRDKPATFRGELLCADCAELPAAASRLPTPGRRIAERAAQIDTTAILAGRLVLAVMAAVLGVGAATIAAVGVYRQTRDTWEVDNRASVLTLVEEARALEARSVSIGTASWPGRSCGSRTARWRG